MLFTIPAELTMDMVHFFSHQNGQTPLMIACQSGDMCYDTAMLLITHGANPNGLPGVRLNSELMYIGK